VSGGRKVHLPSVPEVVMRLDVVVAIAAAAAVSRAISGTTAVMNLLTYLLLLVFMQEL
jgi:hypothetical protein